MKRKAKRKTTEPGKTSPYRLTSPCHDCPFRNDIEGYLRKGRVRELRRVLVKSEFFCHNTTKANQAHCAGALILLEKLGEPSQMMRICERLGYYDPQKLNMEAPVFDSFDDMEAAQSR